MPKSLRCKIKKLCYNGMLTEKERDRIIKALDQKETQSSSNEFFNFDAPMVKNSEKQLIDELSKMPLMVIETAYLHAINYTSYGVDVTEKWLTATQNAVALEKAYKKGYYDAALQMHVESCILIDLGPHELNKNVHIFECSGCHNKIAMSLSERPSYCMNCGRRYVRSDIYANSD